MKGVIQLEGSDTAGPTHDATMTADAREVALKAVAALKADAAPKLRRSKQMGMASQPSEEDAIATEDGNETGPAKKKRTTKETPPVTAEDGDEKGPAPNKQKTEPCGTPPDGSHPKEKVLLSKKQQLAELLAEEVATPQKKPRPLDAGVSSDADVRGLHL